MEGTVMRGLDKRHVSGENSEKVKVDIAEIAKASGELDNVVPKPKELDSKEPREIANLGNQNYYSAKELHELGIVELPMLVEPLFIKSGITVFSGSSDTGKSTFLRQLAISIVLGDEKFLGWKINASHNSVIYVSTEDDKYAISYLLNKTLGNQNLPDSMDNLRYIFNTERLVDNLDAILNENPTDCVIIDALTDIYGGDLNQSNKVRNFLNQYFILADKHNCLFIFLHHTGKRTELLPPSKNNLLGSQGIEGKSRQVIELRRDPNDSKFRHLCVVKGNYLPDEYKTHSFKLNFNEDLTFEMTTERVRFENLVESADDKKEQHDNITERIIDLKENHGYSFIKCAKQLQDEGYPISKSTAHSYYREAKARSSKSDSEANSIESDNEISEELGDGTINPDYKYNDRGDKLFDD
ncbi:AAA family ATPase [uncultured Sunxiuqinia sp.]|uniref:AAA family ATPase n=1 Tax=uncultured Sunxiuqinia sp. TaxID=1573825 RepID=UPI002AA64F5C|nr:AAA family ATPase [uncultured Sunxiuqinia sp.]